MNILVIMIPLSILLLVGAGVAFFWAVEHDQFDDMDTPRLLPLLDNPSPGSIATDGAESPGNTSSPAVSLGLAASSERSRSEDA